MNNPRSIGEIAMGPTPMEQNLEARLHVVSRKLAAVEGKIESFRLWLKANTRGNPVEGNIMAERALMHLRTLLPEMMR